MVDLARNVDLEATWRASVEKQLDDGESSIELHTVETQFFKSEEDACSWAVYNLKKRAEEQGRWDADRNPWRWLSVYQQGEWTTVEEDEHGMWVDWDSDQVEHQGTYDFETKTVEWWG